MSEKSHITIRNSVIASLVAASIISFVEPLRNYALSFLSWAWSGFVWVYDALLAFYSLPGWAWLIILLFALIGLVTVYHEVRPESDSGHDEYTEDRMYGAIWRWRWVGSSVSGLWCYCPNCDATLVYVKQSIIDFRFDPKTDFVCENCGSIVATIKGGDKGYALAAINREIERRVRTGVYKQH